MDFRKILRDNRGIAMSVEFLIIGMFMTIIVFDMVDKWNALIRIQQAEHVKNYYLDRSRLAGGLANADQILMTKALEEMDFNIESISAPPAGSVVRTLNLTTPSDVPEVWLNIELSFKHNPFLLGEFFGLDTPGNIKLSGRAFTEYTGGD